MSTGRVAEAVVEAHGLAVGYGPGAAAVVSGVELVVPAGASVALVGVNGSGKSTLLKTIAGLLAPLSGHLAVLGRPPGQSPGRVAYLGQFHPAAGLLPLRVRDVVLMARYPRRGLLGRITKADQRAVQEALGRVEMDHLADRPLRSLSGGQQQRVYLAHALAREADLLLLDEPTAGLDVHAIGRYRQLVEEECGRGAAVITATHDVGDAARADQVLLLAGAVIAAGSPGEVLTADRLAEAFGLALMAVPHGDHTDLVLPEHPHGHDDHSRGGHAHP